MSGRFQRALDHNPMRNAMVPFRSLENWTDFSDKKIGIPCTFSPDLAVIAQVFAELQDARQFADYDAIDVKSVINQS